MNIVLSIQRVHITKNGEKKAYRRVMNVNEVVEYNNYRQAFKWNAAKDEQEIELSKSQLLDSIADRQGITKKALLEEIERRKNVLKWMRSKNIRSYKDVATIIAEYYARPKFFYEKLLAGEAIKPIAATKDA
jgi:hypothetical protein